MWNSGTGKQKGKEGWDQGVSGLRPHRGAAAPQPVRCSWMPQSFCCTRPGRPWPGRNRQGSDVPPQLVRQNPTHSIQHVAFGSVVPLSHGISHGVGPHEQRVPVVGAAERENTARSVLRPPLLLGPLQATALGKSSSEHHHEQAG